MRKLFFAVVFASLLVGCEGKKGDVGPKGDKGEQGIPGEPGSTGPDGKPGEVLLPLNSRLVYLGNSITALGYVTYPLSAGTAQNFSNVGYVNYANLLSGSRFFVPFTGNRGVPGDASANLIDRLGNILELRPAVAIVEIGTNDINGLVSAAAIQTNLDIIYKALNSVNCKVIAVTVLPRFGANAFTASKEAVRQTINTWIKSRTDIVVVDAESVNSANYFSDGLHPNVSGAFKLGSLVAEKLNAMVVPGNVANGLFVDNTYSPSPLMTGTGGTLKAATGTVANSWELNGSEAGGATVAGTKSTEDKQIINIGGNYAGTDNTIRLISSKTVTGAGAGDVIEGVIDFEILTPMTNIASIDLLIKCYDEKYSKYYAHMQALFAKELDADCPLPVGRYTLRTAPNLLTGVPANYNVLIEVKLKNSKASAPVSGSLKVWSAAVRKI